MPRTVDVYFSAISPWAYLGHAPFLTIAARHSLAVTWKPVNLGELFSHTGGLPLAKRAVQRQRYRMVELQRWAAVRERPIVFRPAHWPFDPTLADRAALAVLAAGGDPAGFIGAAMRGVWEEERDLADRDVIAALLAAEGFDADAILEAAGTPETAARYEANRTEAYAADVFGSPTYVLDGEPFWGQDRLDLLDHALTSGRPAFRPDQ